MGTGYTPSQLREMREALSAFQQAYTAYLQNPGPATKAAALHAMPDAELALLHGGGGVTLLDPPAMGPMRQQYRGLSQTAFIHETGWGQVHGREPYELVLEGIQSADAVLAAEERRVTKARRRPTYWLDRAVRTALMPAAYLVSVIVGESAIKIDRTAWGLPLRLLSLVRRVRRLLHRRRVGVVVTTLDQRRANRVSRRPASSRAEQLLTSDPDSIRVMADTHAVIRTREQELQDSLLGRTVTGVKFDDRTGLVVIRCSPIGEGDEAAYFCFEASGFADAAAIWPELP